MKRLSLLMIVCYFVFAEAAMAQDSTRKITLKRLSGTLKIDGIPDEPEWRQGAVINQLIEFRPDPGGKEKEDSRTEAWILYDNTSIYVGGTCYEKIHSDISRELAGRDNIGVSDFVGVFFDTYHDRINAVGFFVTNTGEQFDARYLPGENDEDPGWNSVYESNAKITPQGWTFEMRIPFSALRFNKKPEQLWGFNFIRQRQKFRQGFLWSKLDPKKNGFVNQYGDMVIPDQLTPPLRLSFSPYFSSYLYHYPYNTPGVKNTSISVNGGLDVKYGINESFTLDMTVIPDFGQVQSDNQVLNLTPFEVKYNENRSFFTEGTELFNKGNLFYSRRVGSAPLHYEDVSKNLQAGEIILKNPSESKLINATKISGRTRHGLGIGYFNAVTKRMYADIENQQKQQSRIETQPLTDYNIIVLDQNLKNNSSVTFINTSVLRSGLDYDANVSAVLFNLYDKKNKFNLFGIGYMSNLFNYNNKNVTGYSYHSGIGKVSGSFTFELSQELTDNKYDPNDLGILFNNNFWDTHLYLGYRKVKPYKWYNNLYFNFNVNHSLRFQPRDYQKFNINANVNGQMKNLWYAGVFLNYSAEGNDFYEPRVIGKVFRSPQYFDIGGFISTNQAKKYSVFTDSYVRLNQQYGWGYNITLGNNFRLNDRISFNHQFNYQPKFNEAGYTDSFVGSDSVIFASRDRNTIENILNAKYSFNNKMFITARVRHYWSKVENKQFYTLNDHGYLDVNSTYHQNKNKNVNIFNVDMVYSWRFAPGSELSLVWKNSIFEDVPDVQRNYFINFDDTIHSPQDNSLSLKILYYLDYLLLRKMK